MDESDNDLVPIQNMVSVTTINNIDEAGKYKWNKNTKQNTVLRFYLLLQVHLELPPIQKSVSTNLMILLFTYILKILFTKLAYQKCNQ